MHTPLAGASGGASIRAEDDVSDAAGTVNGTIAMTAPGQQLQSGQSSGQSSGHSSSQGAPSSCPPASVSSAQGSASACPSLSSAWSSWAALSHGHETPQVLEAAANADAPPSPSGPKNTDTTSSQTAATRAALMMSRVFVMRNTYYTNDAQRTHPRQRRLGPDSCLPVHGRDAVRHGEPIMKVDSGRAVSAESESPPQRRQPRAGVERST